MKERMQVGLLSVIIGFPAIGAIAWGVNLLASPALP